jgi:hypothetical protein
MIAHMRDICGPAGPNHGRSGYSYRGLIIIFAPDMQVEREKKENKLTNPLHPSPQDAN